MEDKLKVLEDIYDVIACNTDICPQDTIIEQFDIEIDYKESHINIYKPNHNDEDNPIYVLTIKKI